jgi:NAD+ diphosphatase
MTVPCGDGYLNLRVGAIIRRGKEFLMVGNEDSPYLYTVGGRIQFGETAEQAVVREIMEETGLTVRNVRYRGSQSWPFPDQLMLAFTAEYESGEIRLQPDEIADAQWFSRDDCPASPQPGSIAYKLIHNEI